MKDDKNLEQVFKRLDFDVFEPKTNHEEAFLKKLQHRKGSSKKGSNVISLWKPFLALAACAMVAFLLFGKQLLPQTENSTDLASVSTEMAKTQNFYSTLIQSEMSKLENQQSPKTKALVEDTMHQLEKLEQDYNQLKIDLKDSGQDKRVIYAMVKNFQQRIELLETVLAQIEDIEQLKTENNENVL